MDTYPSAALICLLEKLGQGHSISRLLFNLVVDLSLLKLLVFITSTSHVSVHICSNEIIIVGCQHHHSPGCLQITLHQIDDPPSNAITPEEKAELLREELEDMGRQDYHLDLLFLFGCTSPWLSVRYIDVFVCCFRASSSRIRDIY